MRKIFTLAIIIGFTYVVLSKIDIRKIPETPEEEIQQEQLIEEKGLELFNKTILIAKEIDNFGQKATLTQEIVNFNSGNATIQTLQKILNYIMLPISITINIVTLAFNIITIITDVNYRITTSYGGGGGGFNGGR